VPFLFDFPRGKTGHWVISGGRRPAFFGGAGGRHLDRKRSPRFSVRERKREKQLHLLTKEAVDLHRLKRKVLFTRKKKLPAPAGKVPALTVT